MPATVFVTGGTGFVGGAVLGRLLASGAPVVALARTEHAAEQLARRGARPVLGDLLHPDSLSAGMRGCGVVYHVAGVVAMCARDPSAMIRANVIGTANVIAAAAAAGVHRVVHTSSTATIGEPAGVTGREDTQHRGWFLSAYERSKSEAEGLVFARGRDAGLEVVCVNPASVQGPGRAEGTGRLLLAAARGRLPVAVRSVLTIVDVEDCAAGHLLAAERGHPGRRYVLAGATLTAEEALELVRETTGMRRRPIMLPTGVVMPAAGLAQTVARGLRRDPLFCREAAATLLHGRAFDGSLATRELGLRYTPIAETIRRTIEWFRREGLLEPRRARREHRPRG